MKFCTLSAAFQIFKRLSTQSKRLELWHKWQQESSNHAVATPPSRPLQIILDSGRKLEGQSGVTTPLAVAGMLNDSKALNSVVAHVNGVPWDLTRPLQRAQGTAPDTPLHLHFSSFEQEVGQQTFWHSSAHILGQALEQYYSGQLCLGPATSEGFYYDMHLPSSSSKRSINEVEDLAILHALVQRICAAQQPFERLQVQPAQALQMFAHNPIKCQIIATCLQPAEPVSLYKCGHFIDLCRGPHLPHTGCVQALHIERHCSAVWNSKEATANPIPLHRFYGIAFPAQKQLTDWLEQQELAKSRDHRKIGQQQSLFFFHSQSPGSCFFLPRGAHIYNTLKHFLRQQYAQRGFQEVITPSLFHSELWKVSGHWEHYAANMFQVQAAKDDFSLKPMNCPAHCLIYAHEIRSFRDLPLRLADFGVLHRNEPRQALTGLTRVRRFAQDDAHIFCREDQIEEEISACLQFVLDVYKIFDFSFRLRLSTRPAKFMGEIALWERAEKQLEASLRKMDLPYEVSPGEGAFYGPKIDIVLLDALKRSHQCATIQLDFQLPERFQLTYMGSPNQSSSSDKDADDDTSNHRPVIIHRAILGSIERMIAILTESLAGKWPFWLSPMQVMVIPVAGSCHSYAQQVTRQLVELGFTAQCDLDSRRSFNKKIRNAQVEQFNFMLVIGEKEMKNGTVNVRTRENQTKGEMPLAEAVHRFQTLCQNKSLHAEKQF